MQKAFAASRIFTGDSWLDDHTIVCDDDRIESLVPTKEFRGEAGQPDGLIIPAFIDAQVYGAANKLFALYPTAATLDLMNETFSKQGTVLFLPTLATNTIEVFKKAIDAVREYWNRNGKGVYGLHLEGPWLDAGKRGAHVKEWIHPPSVEEVRDLLEYGKGVIQMITVAPEVCSDEVLALLHLNKIILSAGHSNASYAEATRSFSKGISTVTHLYNAMSGLHHREPGLVGATLNDEKVKASIIPDGYHVDYAAIGIAKKIMGERLFAITDAVAETSTGPYQHHLAGEKYECNDVLSGSALSMHKAFLNLVRQVHIEPGEAIRMCSLYPAQMLGCDQRYGRIAAGYKARMLVVDREWEITRIVCL